MTFITSNGFCGLSAIDELQATQCQDKGKETSEALDQWKYTVGYKLPGLSLCQSLIEDLDKLNVMMTLPNAFT